MNLVNKLLTFSIVSSIRIRSSHWTQRSVQLRYLSNNPHSYASHETLTWCTYFTPNNFRYRRTYSITETAIQVFLGIGLDRRQSRFAALLAGACLVCLTLVYRMFVPRNDYDQYLEISRFLDLSYRIDKVVYKTILRLSSSQNQTHKWIHLVANFPYRSYA